jgi:hypothetical protein
MSHNHPGGTGYHTDETMESGSDYFSVAEEGMDMDESTTLTAPPNTAQATARPGLTVDGASDSPRFRLGESTVDGVSESPSFCFGVSTVSNRAW